jgi:Fe-Mn family superoxide dismutase
MLLADPGEREGGLVNTQEVAPRALEPALLELDGISRLTIESHYKLYEGYVAKRNQILAQLQDADRTAANPTYSELRALKVELSFALGGIKNHEVYFGHLGGRGGEPDGPFAMLLERDFGDYAAWREDLTATAMAARGWAWAAYDWDEGRLFNFIGDAQNTFPVWNATPLVALDVYEHAYWLDYRTDRASYVEAFFDNLDWGVVDRWVAEYGIRA